MLWYLLRILRTLIKTSKFEWTPDNIRIGKITSALIWATNSFGGLSSTRYWTLSQAVILCNIKES